jgi:hypothetical protein
MLGAVAERFQRAVKEGHGDKDMAATYLVAATDAKAGADRDRRTG